MRVHCGPPPSDTRGADLFAVGIFEDERPLRGTVGILDWRLAGRLSSLLADKQFRGGRGESALVAPAGRFSGTRILVEGLGGVSRFSLKGFEQATVRLAESIAGLRARSAVAALPGFHLIRSWGDRESVTPSVAVRTFLAIVAEAGAREGLADLYLMEDEGVHDEVLLGFHEAKSALKDRKIPLSLVEDTPRSPARAKGRRSAPPGGQG